MTNDGDEVPAFLLQEMPVLESDNQSRVGGQLSLGSDYSSPYPPVGKMRGTVTHSRQEDSLSDHGYSKISGDSLATPVRAFSGYSDPSVGSSPASYHTAASSGYGSSSHSPHGARSSPFVTDNTPSPWRQGGPSSRGNNNSAYYKYPGSVSASFSSSSLNSTPQHMKYSRRPEIDDTPSVISRYRGPNNSDNGLWGDSMNKYQQQQQTPSPNFPSSATTPGSATIISVSSSPPSITRRRGSDVTSVTTSPTNVPWKVSDPAEWPVDRVLYWLETNRFGPDWIDAFQAKNIHGEQFLSLTSYQNFKKLGHMPAGKTDEYDNSPSRFIHILRKMLNKSNSNQSSEDVPLAIEFSKQLHSNTTRVPSAEQTLQSRPALRLPARSRSTGEMKHGIPEPRQQQQPVILSNSSDKGITDDNRDIYIMDKSSPGLSTLIEPFNSVNLKQSPHSEMVSLDSVKQQQQQLPVPRTTRIDRGAPNHVRPFSTVDTVYSKSSLIPSGRSGNFGRHQKSSSSESPLISGMLSQSSTNLSYVFESHDNGKEFNDIEEPRKKGIFNKFRERSNRSRSRDKLRDYYSPTSPVSLSELPISISDASSKTIPTLDQRFLPYKESPILQSSLLVTLNNEHFTSLIISENCGTLDALKDEIGQALGIDASDYQIHLTEIGHQPGDVLDDLAMKEVLSHIRVMNYNATVKLYLKQSGISSSHSTNSEISPAHEFGSRKYPSTPSYLINKNNKQIGQQLGQQSDYFNAKYLAPPLTESQKAEILNHGASNDHEVSDKSILTTDGLLTPNNDSSANSVELIVPKESDLNSVEDLQHSKQQTAESPSSTSDSFKVIRPVRREINFDDRRPSPYERRQSNLVALRTAPPPPKRVPSMKKKIMPGASAGSSKDQPVLSVTTMDLPFPPTTNSVNSYSPAASENLIPRPYVGRKNAVIRKPVNSNTGSESSPSPASPNPSNVLSAANLPASASSIHDVEQIKKASENEQSSATVDKRFQENEVSFDGAPSYDDDSEDSSDDGLWAKKVSPPRTKNALPTLTIPQPDLKIDAAPSLSPTSPYKSPSSAGSPIRASDAWAVRPPEDIVYENLEKFFPNTDLDKPIIDDVTISPGIGIGPLGDVNSLPELSPVVEPRDSPGGTTFKDPWSINPPKTRDESFKEQNRSFHNSVTQGPVSMLRPRMRMKSIRVVAREASEARKKRSSQMVTQPSVGAPNDTLLRRKSTKMWGQRVVEMTASEIRRGHLTSIRDQKGNLQKFAWVKGGLIGKGTFGKVYLALNATTGEMMAVKQVEVPQTASDRSSSRQKEVVSALRTEVETMKDLDHLNIVQYLGFEALEDVYNLFLEYVPGGSVGRILKMHGRFEEVIIKSLTHQVLDGLSYLHSCGILHRDLKADNLLLDLDGVCKISDFGISKKSRDIYANDAEMSMQGTIFWMAPEVIHNVIHNNKQGYSAKVDVWSLGCVVLEMFAGRRPWSTDEAIGAMYKLGKSRQAPPIPEDTAPYVSNIGKEFIDHCFTIDPEQRPTADQLLVHSFCILDNDFDFSKTHLSRLISFDNQANEERRKKT